MGPELEEKKEKNKIKREWQHLTCCINLTGDTLRQKKKFPQTLKSKFTRAPTLTKACFCKLTNTEKKKRRKIQHKSAWHQMLQQQQQHGYKKK